MWVLSVKIGVVEVQIAPETALGTKICPRCGVEKNLEAFARDASKASGRMSRCKECDNAKSREYYAAKHPQGRQLRGRRLRARGLKRCPWCEANKPLEEFRRDRSNPGGLAKHCRTCDNERRSERHAVARARAIRVYGGHCVICGSRKELEFDHIDWDGAEHRRIENHKRMICRIARTGAPIPEYRLRLLCVDCHRARGQALRETLVDGPFDADRVDARLRELRHDAIYRCA